MIKTLVSIKLRAFISAISRGRGKGGDANYHSKVRLIGYAFVYLLAIASFATLAATVAYTIGSLFIPLGFDSLYFGLFMTAALTIIFVLSIFETKSELFESKDNDLLLSMPIKPRHIVISRISIVLIYNYVECAVIMVPATVVYAVLGGSVLGIIGSVVAMLLLPLLATSLSAGVGYLVALVAKRLKRNSFFTTAISLVFLIAYFFGYQSLMNGVDNLAEMSPEVALALAENLGFFGLIGTAALLEPVSIAVLAVASLGTAALFYAVISANYISIVTGNRGSYAAAYRAKRAKSRTAFVSLTIKELRGFVSSANYMLNAGLGVVFVIAVGVLALVNKADLFAALPMVSLIFTDVSDPHAFVASLLPMAIVTVFSMSFISAPALSLEGKRFWVVKSLPLTGRVILLSKLMPHVIISAPAAVITSVLMIIAVEPNFVLIPFILITPLVGVVLLALFGGVIGALIPKFDFQNEIQVIKQSALSLVTMFGSMIICIGFMALSGFLSIVLSPVLSAIIVVAILICASLLLAYLLLGPIARKIDAMEV